jgi:hypothetical protein
LASGLKRQCSILGKYIKMFFERKSITFATVKITILVDDYLTQPSSLRMRLLGEWGFAAYVHGYRIL